MTTAVDLHIHTTASDGSLTPEEVVEEAARRDLTVISITDHDSVDAIAPAQEAATRFPPLRVIPGVEISTDDASGAVHILGYFVDHEDEELRSSLKELRHYRELRAQLMIAKLVDLGVPLEWQWVQQMANGGAIGRPHIARAMVERGYISSIDEAFIKYIGRRGPAYVKRTRLSPEEAVGIVKKARGLPVLAHPRDISNLETLLVKLKKAGLVGLETYYDGYGDETVKWLITMAGKYGLLTSGGSDFHGIGGDSETPIGGAKVPEDCAQRLILRAGSREAVSG